MLKLRVEHTIDSKKISGVPSARECMIDELLKTLIRDAHKANVVEVKEEPQVQIFPVEFDRIKFSTEMYVMRLEEIKELEKVLREMKNLIPVGKQDLFYQAISLITKR